MGYYVRVLTTSSDCPPLSSLQAALAESGFKASLSVSAGSPDDWDQIILSHPDEWPISCIERSLVSEGELGAAEMAQFAEEVANAKPESAARWLLDYFPNVRCVVSFQVLSGTDRKKGWEILDAVKERIWRSAPSILQADDEGFSNEAGYHILWQFGSGARGSYAMGILQDGEWRHFRMKLGNRKQREAFLRGEVPEGCALEPR